MPKQTEKRDVPIDALRFGVSEFEIGSNGDGAKTAPVKVLARSKEPVNHWYWGRVVHDMAGMKTHKPRLALDYCHDDDEIIGYLNNFNTEDGSLRASGAITPFTQDDRASEVLYKWREGVPYEADRKSAV